MVGNRFDEEIENLLSIDSSGNLVLPAGMSIVAASPTSLVGYSTGAGGTIAQGTSKTTAVTLNKVCGAITTFNTSMDAAADITFKVNNTLVAATDTVAVSIVSGGTSGSYFVCVGAVAADSFYIVLTNASAGALGEEVVINFVVIKGVDA